MNRKLSWRSRISITGIRGEIKALIFLFVLLFLLSVLTIGGRVSVSLLPYVTVILLLLSTGSATFSLAFGLASGIAIFLMGSSKFSLHSYLSTFMEIVIRVLSTEGNVSMIVAIVAIGFIRGLMKFGRSDIGEYISRKNLRRKYVELLIFGVGLVTFLSQYLSYMVMGFFKDALKRTRGAKQEAIACIINVMSINPCPILSFSVWGLFLSNLVPKSIFEHFNILIPFVFYTIISTILVLSYIHLNWHTSYELTDFQESEEEIVKVGTEGSVMRKDNKVIERRVEKIWAEEKLSNKELTARISLFFVTPITMTIILPLCFLRLFHETIARAIVYSMLIIIFILLLLVILYALFLGYEKYGWSPIMVMELKNAVFKTIWARESVEEGGRQGWSLAFLIFLILTFNTLTTQYLNIGEVLTGFLTLYSPNVLFYAFLPVFSFGLSAFFAWLTGSAFATMGTFIPPFIKLSMIPGVHINLTQAVIGAIISGATFGNMCSELGDSILFVKHDYLTSESSKDNFKALNNSLCYRAAIITSVVYLLLPLINYDWPLSAFICIMLGLIHSAYLIRRRRLT